jgi:hypothetical protein
MFWHVWGLSWLPRLSSATVQFARVNRGKFFASVEVLELGKVANAVSQLWKDKYLHKKGRSPPETGNGLLLPIDLSV